MLKKILGVVVALLVVATVAAWACVKLEVFNVSREELISRYALPESQWIELDGAPIHVVDQGQGPAIVLIHGHFMNLRLWDEWVRILTPKYRVIRYDRSPYGLSGDDPAGYTIERQMEQLGRLLDRLGLERVTLVGTSSGGINAFRFAALHPERVERLVLINSGGLPRPPVNPLTAPPANPLRAWLYRHYRPRSDLEATARKSLAPGKEPPEWLVDQYYEMNRRRGANAGIADLLRSYKTGNPQEMLGRIRVPTLVMWGLDNQLLPHSEADLFAQWITGAPVTVKKIPGAGHLAIVEKAEELANELAAFMESTPEPATDTNAELAAS